MRYWGYARRPLALLLTWRSAVPLNWVRAWVYTYILVAFWRAVYGGAEQAAGFTLPQIVSYVVAAQVIGGLLATTAQERLEQGVHDGTVVLDLLKPVSLPLALLADALGTSLGVFISNGVPMLIFGIVVFHMRVIVAPATLGLVLLLALLGFVLRQLMDCLVGYAAFWTVRTAGIDRLVNWVVFSFLGGSFVPYAFFPAWAQAALRWSPLAGLYSSPVQVWVGRMPLSGGLAAAGVDVLWIAILAGVLAWVHNRAMRRVLSFGG
jgi:ABC-2 type transport system permease protein